MSSHSACARQTQPAYRRLVWASVFFAAAAFIQGCSAPDTGFGEVQATTADRTGYSIEWTRGPEEDRTADERVAELLSDDLTLEEAIQVALLSNRGLQATFEELGIGRGQLIQAGLLENPVFVGEWYIFDKGTVFEGALVENVISAITIPMRRQLQGEQLEATKLVVTAQVVHLVGDVKRAYFLYQANKQLVEMLQHVVQATKASYMTMDRLREAGNARQLDVFRERALYEEAKVQLNVAVELLAGSREQMNTLMGLWGPQTVWETRPRLPAVEADANETAMLTATEGPEGTPAILPGQLPPKLRPPRVAEGESLEEAAAETFAGPPVNEDIAAFASHTDEDPNCPDAEVDRLEGSAAERYAQIERLAVERSLDLAAVDRLVNAQVGRLKLETTLAIFPFLNVGAVTERNAEDKWGWGPTVESPIPLFDWGQGQVPQETSRLRQRLEVYANLAVVVRSVARTAEAQLQASRNRALYLQEVVLPLHAALVAEAQLQYNAMQVTPFELMQAQVLQIQAGQQYIIALLEYWIAHSNVEQILDGSLPPAVLAHGVVQSGVGGFMLQQGGGMMIRQGGMGQQQ